MSLEPGTRLGRYEITSPLGAGGMGEVYLATDAELNRPVALKFLPVGVAADEKRMARFVQEARAASALNHPNIITIYDIGQTEDGTRFFATEFVEGETLRERLSRGGMKLGEVLDVAAQIASALVAAHAAGIVHRDIKPENVMIRRDGYVKVLDFGLAKLTGNPESSVDTEAATRALAMTDPGSVMGTVAYMSPEQAAGKDVDARTDIWSLGVVLYEMLTGRTPFAGRSSSHTIVAILDEEPPPLARFLPDAPESLQELVSDALMKDREARFQTAKQMLAKLRRLKGRLDAGASLEYSTAPNPTTRASHEAADFTASLDAQTRTGSPVPPRTTAHTGGMAAATQPGASPRRRRRPALIAVGVVVVAAVVTFVGLAVYRFIVVHSHTEEARAPFAQLQNMKFTKLPAGGITRSAVISPDGRLVARVADEAGKTSLRLRQLATPNEKEVVAPSEDFYLGVTFSPDGEFLYFVRGKRGQFFHELFRVGVLGGEPQRVVFDIDSVPAVSPDGKRLAFVRRMPKTDEDTLVMANADGGGEQVIATRQRPSIMDSPAWSPDGRAVAFTINGRDDTGYFVHVEEVSIANGSARVISGERWRSIGAVAWLPDGSGLVVNARDRASLPGTPLQIWHISYPGGASSRVTNDLNYYNTISLTADARTLLAVQNEGGAFNLWVAPAGDITRGARQVTSDGTGDQPAWTADGHLVYYSQASGNGDIWMMGADGSGARQLTTDENNDSCPAVSPDGRFVAFVSNRGVGWGVWRMNIDGGDAKELMRNVDQGALPQWSADSRFVFYSTRDKAGRLALWKVPADGGEPAKITDTIDGNTVITPDGKTFFTLHRDAEPGAPLKIIIVPANGGAPTRTLDAPDAMQGPRWSPDSQAIDYVTTTEGVSNLWRLQLAGGKPRQLTDWKSDLIGWFAWSADGKQLALSRGTQSSDIVLIKGLR
jgi:Tol biopolymer transport system component/tRNA A-37 threonylcarbamoyl transferase component Bud32